MKKIALFALLALFVSVAQAVNIDWTLKIGGPNENQVAGFGPGWCGLFMLPGAVDTITKADLPASALATNSPATDYTPTGSLADAVKIKVDGTKYYANLGAASAKTLTFQTEGVATDTVTFVLFNGWNFNNKTAGYALLTVTDIDTSATSLTIDLSDVTLEWAQATVNTYTASAVPEPTALALLALGVAGLALRRRA